MPTITKIGGYAWASSTNGGGIAVSSIAKVGGVDKPTAGTSYYDEVMADSPVCYWRLGEASGTLNDSSGTGNHGTSSGITYGVAGKIAGDDAISIATGAQTNRVEKTSATSLPTSATAAWSIEFWHKSSTFVSLSQMFGFGNPFNATTSLEAPTDRGCNRYMLQFNSNYYFWGDSADWDTGVAFDTDGNWHHIVTVCDGTDMIFYRDGVSAATRSGRPFTKTSKTAINAGSCHDGGSAPTTILDECAIYAAALSSTRIAAHFSAA